MLNVSQVYLLPTWRPESHAPCQIYLIIYHNKEHDWDKVFFLNCTTWADCFCWRFWQWQHLDRRYQHIGFIECLTYLRHMWKRFGFQLSNTYVRGLCAFLETTVRKLALKWGLQKLCVKFKLLKIWVSMIPSQSGVCGNFTFSPCAKNEKKLLAQKISTRRTN